MNPNLNKAQAVCLETYSGGDFAHLVEVDSKEELDAAMADCGDTLLQFLMIELSASEDCDSTVTAINRITTAISDLTNVLQAIQALPQ